MINGPAVAYSSLTHHRLAGTGTYPRECLLGACDQRNDINGGTDIISNSHTDCGRNAADSTVSGDGGKLYNCKRLSLRVIVMSI